LLVHDLKEELELVKANQIFQRKKKIVEGSYKKENKNQINKSILRLPN